MLESYIEALLVNEELADQVWSAQDSLTVNDEAACAACVYIVFIRDRSSLVT